MPDDAGPRHGKVRVFISYSRDDKEFVARLAEALEIGDVEVLRDTKDILPSEVWRKKIEELISRSDTVVFVVSPSSIESEVVQWELGKVKEHSKRLIPVVFKAVPDEATPEDLSRLNYIYFTDPEAFMQQVRTLLGAIRTEINWLRQHTDFGLLALRWKTSDGSRADDLLLRGNMLEDAERWLRRRPRDAPERAVMGMGRLPTFATTTLCKRWTQMIRRPPADEETASPTSRGLFPRSSRQLGRPLKGRALMAAITLLKDGPGAERRGDTSAVFECCPLREKNAHSPMILTSTLFLRRPSNSP